MEPLYHFTDPEFGVCKVLHKKEGNPENVCLFASHTILPFLPEYVYYYLDEIKKADFSIVFISSSFLNQEDVQRLSQVADVVIEKDNRGTDFGAWCAVLRWLNYGKDFNSLYLCNDSVFGPFVPMDQLHSVFTQRREEILGITDSHQGVGYHIQSYFVGLKKSVLISEAWESFWRDMIYQQDKQKVIELYEAGLTQVLLKAGFFCFVWSDWTRNLEYQQILSKVSQSAPLRNHWLKRALDAKEHVVKEINPSSFFWKELIIHCNNPLLKREVFLFQHLFEECEVEKDWEQVLQSYTSYPVAFIKEFLVQFFFYKSWKSTPEYQDLKIFLTGQYPDRIQQKGVSGYNFLLSLPPLFQRSQADESRIDNRFFTYLDKLSIPYTVLTISVKDQEFECVFIYLDNRIADLTEAQVSELKETLKQLPYSLLIVPDNASTFVVSSILKLKTDSILVEKQLLTPMFASVLLEEIKLLSEIFLSGMHPLNIYQRSAMEDVVADILHHENRTGFMKSFLKMHRLPDVEMSNEHEIDPAEREYRQFQLVRDKYVEIYESAPTWYKKLGQVIKLVYGKKRLMVKMIDKGRMESYRATADDVAHWYHLQYEVLPEWYKSIGRKLKKQRGNDEL